MKVETPIGVLDWTKTRPGVPWNVVADADPRRAVGEGEPSKFTIDFVICEHSDDPKIPVGGEAEAYTA